jgi:hypothetical protein
VAVRGEFELRRSTERPKNSYVCFDNCSAAREKETIKRSGQRSAVVLATQQFNTHYLQTTCCYAIDCDDGEMTGDGVRTVRRRRRRCDGSSRQAYMAHRRATSTAKDDWMIARGGRHRMSEIKNGQTYRRVGSRSVI